MNFHRFEHNEKHTIDRRGFLGITGLGLAACALPDEKRTDGTIRIAHLCDPQFGFTSGRQSLKHRAKDRYEANYKADIARCEKAIAIVNELKPDLLLFGGDMAHFAKDIPLEWPRLLKMVKVPWMATPGNHDFEYRPGYGPSRACIERFKSVFGRCYESRDIKGWRVIAGNSQFWFPSEAKAEQEEYESWIGAEFEKARAYGNKVIIASHIPPYACEYDEPDSYHSCPLALRKKRLEAYLASGARFYLTAHQHRVAARGYKDLTILTGEALCANMDLRPTGLRIFEAKENLSYSWNFVEVP